jgi:hypothetical protein
MLSTTDNRGYYLIEGRWEHTHNAPGEDAFFKIDEIGGTLDDAKRAAQTYFNRHVAPNRCSLEWVVGINQKKQCHYAHDPDITLRITR